jgi:hypothetical protein
MKNLLLDLAAYLVTDRGMKVSSRPVRFVLGAAKLFGYNG